MLESSRWGQLDSRLVKRALTAGWWWWDDGGGGAEFGGRIMKSCAERQTETHTGP